MTFEETVDRFRDAWNRHDAPALASLWSDDGELNHPWGYHRTGRDAIRTLLETEHTGSMAASELTIERITTHPAGANVVAEIEGVLSNVRAPNGKTYELPHVITAMFVRNGEEWRIRTMTPVANGRRGTLAGS